MNQTAPSIITVTLNPCLDRTSAIADFILNGTNKVLHVREDLSGKGINVSIALHQWDINTCCLGFDYISGEKQVGKMLAANKITHHLVPVEGTVRVNIKIFNEKNGTMTEFNEKGQPVTEENIQQLLKSTEQILTQAHPDSILVLSGSVPAGVPATIYRSLIELSKAKNIRVLLDTSGELLIEGVKARPYAIKPNQDEIAQLTGHPVNTIEDAAHAAIKCNQMGIPYVCVSLGAKGALLSSSEGVFYAPPAPVKVKGIQGAGDSLVAGMCVSFLQGKNTETALRYATAAAGGSVGREGTLMCTKEEFERLLPLVKVEQLSIR
ncbi:MAG: 1-phosphofructokinase family hexose kinase [Eubacteriales bacterium]|nr:1-phosphofructokinase family hexose kinase [Eubacteriales bacterium]